MTLVDRPQTDRLQCEVTISKKVPILLFTTWSKFTVKGKLSLALSLSDQTESEPNRQQSHSILNQNY